MRKQFKKNGFTLSELAATILIGSILIASIGVIMVDTQRGWLDTYAKVHGGAVDDAAMAKSAFDKVVRKASHSAYNLAALDDLTVYYYADWQNSAALDRSARFYRSSTNPSEMYIEHARLDNGNIIGSVLLASNVSDLEFCPLTAV